jgi:hypothetical protein
MSRWLLAVLMSLGMAATAEAQKKPAKSTPAPPPAAAPTPGGVTVPLIIPIRQAGLRLGWNPRVRILTGSRLDPAYAAADDVLAATPRDALADYISTQQVYQLYIPFTYRPNVPHPLIVFLSASGNPNEFTLFASLCRRYGVLFASPYNAGDDTAPGRRLRIAMDTLEDVRRRLSVDNDRTYLGGFKDGARLASDIAFSYPEFIGGLLAVGSAGGLRNEPWMRDRVSERLSVAAASGELSPARAEMDRWRLPVLRDAGVRTKLWLLASQIQAMPSTAELEEMFVWLELSRAKRRAVGAEFPTTRMADGIVLDSESWAAAVVLEARKRLGDRKIRESGLMQLEGVTTRWKDTEAAKQADRLLKAQDDWRKVYSRRQLDFAYREAKGVDAYLEVLADPARLPGLLRIALVRWEEVEKQGVTGKEAQEARKRLIQLRRLVRGR